MTYLGSERPRFIVSEIEGFNNVRVGSDSREGVTITVVDRAYCCAVMRMWRTEERGGKISRWMKLAELRSEATAFCDTLNARTDTSNPL